jgi:aminoglycoside phosphotransferase (APT) family kinase protein
MRRIAAAIAALHRGPVQPQRTQPVGEEWDRLQRSRQALLRFYPALAREIHETLDTLLAVQPNEPTERHPIHGDLHSGHILLRDRHVAIIDFDHYAWGDPLLDVARFLSHFRALARGEMDESEAAAAQESFLGTYEILVPWKMDRMRLGALMAALMINHQALKPVMALAADSEEHVLAFLSAANGFREEQEWR